ncbi:hypothetical protein CHU93_04080 [Sandarakinorhabdus cyanobacteriorum]|uniref:Uncharacterized protein n=1 Tax=Sandarakinorhabdus cyanobacteriorum TaxID=1981098 RepID=A0A255YRQ7_9SPHN|nr:hypothetical protein [Sandarakinorhabdus cyanobacteriorum]OYQ31903.1 hypothetical protein CHU93_04080 [Sandarakinorhabdus cyanobacteriorum]
MLLGFALAVTMVAQSAPPVAQEAPANVPFLAQMLDRCMATHAVRLSKTDMDDAAIYAEAGKGCAAIDQQLRAGVRSQMPPAEAEALIKQFDATDRPNFLVLLQRIRADRVARGNGN